MTIVVEESQDVLVEGLFTALKQGPNSLICAYIANGASVRVRDAEHRYPLHYWILRKYDQRDLLPFDSKALALFSPDPEIINSLDNSGCSPLSLAIAYDVVCWTRASGVNQPDYECILPPFEMIRFPNSQITKELLDRGGALSNLRRNGYTPWHSLASSVYSSAQNYPGLSADLDYVTFLLVVRNFWMVGGLDLNLRDPEGRTGLDIFCDRFDLGTLRFRKEDFPMMLEQLKSIGCKRSSDMK
jgi:hypothetical protein